MRRRPATSLGDLRGHIERSNVQEQLVGQLRAAIIKGRLRPGQTITQQELAAAFRVSRQPVRQAIEVLAAEGLMAKSPHGGAIVTPLDPGWVRDLYEVRARLEALAVAEAAARLTPESLGRLEAALEQGRSAFARQNLAELIAADQRFHHTIYETAGNRVLLETLGRYWSQVARVMRAILSLPGYSGDIWQQHGQIVEALRAREAPRAADLIQRHVLGALNLLLEHPALLAGAATKASSQPSEANLCT